MLAPGYISGIRTLMEKLLDSFGLDDQDQAWVALDKFFSYSRSHNTDFNSYLLEWERLFDEACRFGGLQINDICKTFMFFSRSGLNDKQLADLRLKVNGDLTRFNDMVRLQNKITKNELASQDQQQGYRGYGYQSNHHDDDHTDYYDDGWHIPDDDSWYWDDYYGDWFYDDGTDYYDNNYEDDSWDYDGDPNWEEEYDYNNNAEPTDENSEQYKGSKGKGKGKAKARNLKETSAQSAVPSITTPTTARSTKVPRAAKVKATPTTATTTPTSTTTTAAKAKAKASDGRAKAKDAITSAKAKVALALPRLGSHGLLPTAREKGKEEKGKVKARESIGPDLHSTIPSTTSCRTATSKWISRALMLCYRHLPVATWLLLLMTAHPIHSGERAQLCLDRATSALHNHLWHPAVPATIARPAVSMTTCRKAARQ